MSHGRTSGRHCAQYNAPMSQARPLTSLTLDSRLSAGEGAAETFALFSRALWSQPYVPAELLELCRLTFARLHRDEAEIAAANPHLAASDCSPAKRAAVLGGRADRDPALSAIEQAVLGFAEYFWLDAGSITDAAANGVKAHIGEAGLVFLIEALGCLDGRIRTARCLRDPGDDHAG